MTGKGRILSRVFVVRFVFFSLLFRRPAGGAESGGYPHPGQYEPLEHVPEDDERYQDDGPSHGAVTSVDPFRLKEGYRISVPSST